MEILSNLFTQIMGGPGVRLWPLYLPGMILLAYVIYRKEQRSEGFLNWLFPRSMYLHKSHLVDIQLFIFGRLIALLGIFQKIAVSVFVTTGTVSVLGGLWSAEFMLAPWTVALLMLLASDFSTYWIHRLHHEFPTLWPFHAVHHSAEVMTPITAYRKHPFYDVVSSLIRGVIVGLAQGLLLSIFVSEVGIAMVLGINVFYVAFNSFAANLRHSHVWLSFGPVWEHIFISPAQHQVHHSIDKQHYNKNYGEVLAIWDWMFGTLYVPETREEIAFGLGDNAGNPLPQPHTSLRMALTLPVKQSLATLRRKPKAVQKHITPAE